MPEPPREIRIGDRVRVSSDAPAVYHPGSEGTVTDIRRLDDEGVGCRIAGAPVGAILRILDSRGVSFEVPSAQVRHE